MGLVENSRRCCEAQDTLAHDACLLPSLWAPGSAFMSRDVARGEAFPCRDQPGMRREAEITPKAP